MNTLVAAAADMARRIRRRAYRWTRWPLREADMPSGALRDAVGRLGWLAVLGGSMTRRA